jgi:acetyl esterase/lipase
VALIPSVRPSSAAALAVLTSNYLRQNVKLSPRHAADLAGLALLTVGMGRAAADSRATAGVLRHALDEACGSDWHAHVERPVWPEQPDELRRSGMLQVARSRRRFTRLHDVVYGDTASSVLDLWRHPELPAGARAPIVLQIPGGAWVLGNKQGQAYPLMNHLAENGWICASMTYRLAPRHPWPAHIVDVKRAIVWLREHADEIGGDPDFIVLTGGSAGGHLCSLAALSQNDPAFQPGFEALDTSVSAAVPLYGRYDWFSREGPGRREFMYFLERVVVQEKARRRPQVFQAASPIFRRADMKDAPPFFVLHGRNDSIIPVQQARDFAATLSALSNDLAVYAELPGAQHCFDLINSARTREVCRAVEGFLGVVLGRHRARTYGSADDGQPAFPS